MPLGTILLQRRREEGTGAREASEEDTERQAVVNPSAHKPAMHAAAFTIDKIILSEYNASSIRAPFLSTSFSTFESTIHFALFVPLSSFTDSFPPPLLSPRTFRSRSRFHCNAFERSVRTGTPNLYCPPSPSSHPLAVLPLRSRYIIPVRQIQ